MARNSWALALAAALLLAAPPALGQETHRIAVVIGNNRGLPAEQPHHRAGAALFEVDAAQRHRHDLGARSLERAARLVHILVLAGANEEAGAEAMATDAQPVVVRGGHGR